MYKPLEVEPAKSNKSLCKNCQTTIEKDALRIKVVDDRQFQEYIKQHGKQNLTGEGLSRGYFEDEAGTISIQKYFVHLECYIPIHPHPRQMAYFRKVNFKEVHFQAFIKWINNQQAQEKNQEHKNQKKTKGIRKQNIKVFSKRLWHKK